MISLLEKPVISLGPLIDENIIIFPTAYVFCICMLNFIHIYHPQSICLTKKLSYRYWIFAIAYIINCSFRRLKAHTTLKFITERAPSPLLPTQKLLLNGHNQYPFSHSPVDYVFTYPNKVDFHPSQH